MNAVLCVQCRPIRLAAVEMHLKCHCLFNSVVDVCGLYIITCYIADDCLVAGVNISLYALL